MYDPRTGLTQKTNSAHFFSPSDILKRDDENGDECSFVMAHNDNVLTYLTNNSNSELGTVAKKTTLRFVTSQGTFFFDVYGQSVWIYNFYQFNIKEIVQSVIRENKMIMNVSSSYYVNFENGIPEDIDVYVIVYDEDYTMYQEYTLVDDLMFLSGYFQNRRLSLNGLVNDNSDMHTCLTKYTQQTADTLNNAQGIKVWKGYPMVIFTLINKEFDEVNYIGYSKAVGNTHIETRNINASGNKMISAIVEDGSNSVINTLDLKVNERGRLLVFFTLTNNYVARRYLYLTRGESCDNGVYLRWRNSVGTWSFWLFPYVYHISNNAKLKGSYYKSLTNNFIDNDYRRNAIYKESEAIITVGGTFTLEDMETLQSLFTSAEVFIYTAEKDSGLGLNGSGWEQFWDKIEVTDGKRLLHNTKHKKIELSFAMILNDQYNHFK